MYDCGTPRPVPFGFLTAAPDMTLTLSFAFCALRFDFHLLIAFRRLPPADCRLPF